MRDFSWQTAAIIFVVYIVFDVLNALYVFCVSQRQPVSSSIISMLLYSLSAYGVMSYIHNPLYLIPLASGALLGTYVAVKYVGNWLDAYVASSKQSYDKPVQQAPKSGEPPDSYYNEIQFRKNSANV